MKKLLRCLLLCCFAVAPNAFAARAAQPLEDPPPVPVPSQLTQDQARRAIHLAADKYGWVISQESPGHSFATVTSGDHLVSVDVAYETRLISINYIDSQHMSYELAHNVRYIHPKYMKWTRTLSREIADQLAAIAKPTAAPAKK